ncbi:MAG: M56 family metallopeptidase [Bacteroidales bacterium]|nr:M56 family metallopeptidase [Lachnoclostridium sp.]MCM1383212.1 M56 family metallopeptidase [Lachnoclostridium sp.]MCM1464563.1 M56 family metallopeptidase [Bacteroidales bacterium]
MVIIVSEIFLKVMNLSISAAWLILVVMILRIAFKKAPKWISVLLWGIVALRLSLPFSVESKLSLLPSAETIPVSIMSSGTDTAPAIDSGIYAINRVVNPIIQSNVTAADAGANPRQITIEILSYIWGFGAALLLLYAAVSYWRLHRKVGAAVLYDDNIFQSEKVSSPFVLGIIKPKIYLPFKIKSEELEHVIAHEKAHIRRKDHWWKPLGFLLLSFHWFNPLIWLAYALLCRDIELACDEKVIKKLGNEQRADYTQALLNCSVSRPMLVACPVAFGEVSVKERVKSVANYKKPAFWVIMVSIIVCVVVAVCFLTNPKRDGYDIKIIVPAGSREPMVYSHEEISPSRNHIIITSGSNLGDTEIALKPIEVKQERAYDETVYLTPGTPVKMEAEKGAWFKVGIHMPNPTEKDIEVYVHIENIEVRIADKAVEDLEQHTYGEAASAINDTDEPSSENTAVTLDDAISDAILHFGGNDSAEGLIHVESHYTVYTEEKGGRITVYLQALESSYRAYDGNLYQESGSNLPTAITFSVSRSADNGPVQYTLEEYWIPREGSYYLPDLKEKFPQEALDVLDAAHGEIQKLDQECYEKAMAQFELTGGLELRIAELLDIICTSPAALASNPRDYIAAHDGEYRELLGYGEYTLRYCIAKFLEGGQTDLKGHIMRSALDDLAPDMKCETQAATGQEYFDEWKAHAKQAAEEHDAEWVEKYQPAVWILLEMMDE